MARAHGLFIVSLLAAACTAVDDNDVRDEAEGVPRAEGEAVRAISQAQTSAGGLAADAYVRSGSSGTNYGTATTVLSDSDDAGSQAYGYIRLSIGNISSITSARLRLYVTNGSVGPINVKQVSSTSWGETSITWSNKPAVDGVQVATIGATSTNSWVDVDIKSVAKANTTISLAFVPGTSDGFAFSSRNATSNQPQVIIGTGGGTSATNANLKIAFVGDTADGSNWKSVLNLIKAEGAQAVVIAGDMTYNANPSAWWSATESVLGQSYPVFLARGNHDDSSWSGFLGEAANHLGGATRVNGPHDAAYKTIFRGLTLIAIKKGDSGSTISSLIGTDSHVWKVCHWHQNQNKMQVGGKGDEMGWDVYETCRQKGAIIITGHEHSYHRTKTMTNTQTQTISSTCSSGSSLCVGPGQTFVTVVGTGGTGLRSQVRCTPTASSPPYASLNTSDSSCPAWASIYTTNQGANYGAQFITFNVDGNPRKARGYFKDIAGRTIDSFVIFAD